ncbi:MAG: carboxyl transferase [Oscillospiraceae bacterium]|nr:carboxyl transferase [Oscillospiraceae bacterium]
MSAKNYRQMRGAFSAGTPARSRIDMLFDQGAFSELAPFASVGDMPCGVICGYGSVNGSPVCAFAQEGGGLGKAQADKISRLYDLALKTGVPVVGIYDSLGANIAEGVAALEAYGELLLRVNNLSGVVPQISIIAGDCTGSSALLAMSADFVVMSESASFFLTPPSLLSGAQECAGGAEAAGAEGVAHLVCADADEAVKKVAELLSYLPLNNLSPSPVRDFSAPEDGFLAEDARYDDASPRDIAAAVCDAGSILPLMEGFGKRGFAALATMGGSPVGIAATGGALCERSARKIAKLVSVCDSFGLPVITLVNAPGVKAPDGAGTGGLIQATARLAHIYAEATTAKLSVITGRAYGAAYVALCSRAANSDYTVAWPGAVITPMAPQAAVAFAYSDRITAEVSREEVVRGYEEDEASPLTAAAAGYLDDVISPKETRAALLAALELLSAKRVSRNPKKHSNLPL